MALIHCPDCGAQVSDTAPSCPSCGRPIAARNPFAEQPPPAGTPRFAPKVNNHLTEAILVTLCCCLIPGIVAIVYAGQVNGKLAAGDYQGAVEASNKAATWCWVGVGLGVLVSIAYAAMIAMNPELMEP